MIRPRTRAAIAAARGAGIRVVIATGRMFRSVRPYAEAAGIDDPVICYQGAAIVEPASGRYLLHLPIPLEAARDVIAAVQARGFSLNVYVDDELYVERLTPEAERYATFQNLPVTPVGPVLDWLEEAPTKLVTIGDPGELDRLEIELKRELGERLFIAKSLPYFLEFADAGVTKGSALAFLADTLGFSTARTVAFGDGENDVELLEEAGYAVAVADAHPRLLAVADWLCPPAAEEGVAQVLEAMLAGRRS